VVVDVAPDETATSLFERLADAHVELVRELVPQLVAGTAPRIPQEPNRASSWPRRAPADGIIDWETRAPYLYDWVRAQTRPYPGAFTFLGDEKVVVWGARPVELAEPAPAGTIVELAPEGPVVACGEGGLVLEEISTDAPDLAVGARLG
jgi:methionyl-tRNA formyltransferase